MVTVCDANTVDPAEDQHSRLQLKPVFIPVPLITLGHIFFWRARRNKRQKPWALGNWARKPRESLVQSESILRFAKKDKVIFDPWEIKL